MAAPSINRGTPRTGGGPSRRQISQTHTIPAPTGGLNAINAISNMPETDALVLDNAFPQPNYVEWRNGYGMWATGFPGWVETLLTYSNGAGEKLFGISGGGIYNATAQGAIGAAVVSGLSNSRWEFINMATAGGQFLWAANAADNPLLYDGTTWTPLTATSSPAVTGVTVTKLRSPTLWKNRLWLIEDGTLHGWYLPTASIAGAAAEFDFGPIFTLGGQLQSIFTASLTDGSTFDDYICFMTTEGEIALYNGTDPQQAGMFNIQGIFKVGKPVGRRSFFRSGTDTIIICTDGFASLSQLIAVGRLNTEEAISYKIQGLVNADIKSYADNFGWQGIVYPLGNKTIVNVPQNENSRQYQYVMNTLNNSWCTFGFYNSPWNAATFAVQGNSLYFGGANYIALADTGLSDNGNNILALIKPAYSYLGANVQKQITMARPIILSDGTINATLNVNVDFEDVLGANAPTFSGTAGAPWNTSAWNTSAWTTGLTVQKNWLSAPGLGFAISLYFAAATNGSRIQFASLDYLFQTGTLL